MMNTASTTQWAFGDRVVHSSKPEWGSGVITSAATTTHEGKPCQSLTIRFDRAGVKTISTAFAHLIPADRAGGLLDQPQHDEPQATAGGPSAVDPAISGPGSFGARDPKEVMRRLPESTTDPFSTPLARLRATLGLYRFNATGASLLDWAAIQSGLADPLSRFNRHELERFFEGFAVVRDTHLKKLVAETKRTDPSGLAAAVAQAPAAAHQVLRRLDTGR